MISIIVPVYNTGKYLEECIESIIRQTFRDFELLLIDDGSTDDSGVVCKKYASKYAFIHYFNKANEGVSKARYYGLLHASGDYISFIDHDDIVSPYLYEILFSMIDDDTDVAIIKRKNLDSDNINTYMFNKVIPSKGQLVYLQGEEACNKFTNVSPFCDNQPLWGKLYRKAFLESQNFEKNMEICPTLFFEDVLITKQIVYSAKKIVYFDSIQYLHREISTSISRSRKINLFYLEQIYSFEILLNFLLEKNCIMAYQHVLHLYLNNLLRLWYLLKNKKEYEKYSNYIQIIETHYEKWVQQFAKHLTGIIDCINYKLFNQSPTIWSKTLGFLYFDIYRKY